MNEDDLIEALKALAHPLRWRILTALIAGERNVGEIEAATGINQPGLSQQLSVLRKAGLVETRKEAKLVFYGLADGQIGSTLGQISSLLPVANGSRGQTAATETPAPGVANFARMF
jgi:DNA-binding transcriptional ArsR family regulator